ncbi:serine/threonine protein kinase [Pleurocapsales cyanobacterium LEGE 06147]|nr:serine/threonine protein kinase [Pleurocapsales cyanobacterium LEGE 06147]
MVVQFTRLGQILAVSAIGSLVALEAVAPRLGKAENAQTEPTEAQPQPISMMSESIPAAFNRAFFTHTGNAFENQNVLSQLNSIFGFNFYPEKQITLDGELVNSVYKDVLQLQTASIPPVRTRDLSNPFNTSLRENPGYIPIVPPVDSNFNFGR